MSRISLRSALLAAFLVASGAPLLVFWLWPHTAALSREMRDVREQHLLIAQTLAGALASYNASVTTLFEGVAPRIAAGDDLAYAERLMEALHFRHVCVADRETGAVRRSFMSAGPPCPTVVPAERLALLKGLARPERSAMTQATRIAGDEPGLLIVLAVGPDLVIGALRTTHFANVTAAVNFGVKGHAVVVDRTGRVLAHPRPDWTAELHDLGKLSVVQAVAAGGSGVGRFLSEALGAEVIAGYAPVPGAGWGVIVPQPVSELHDKAEAIAASARLVFGLGLVLSAVIALGFSRHLGRSIGQVADAARRMGAGDERARVPSFAIGGAMDEIATLGRNFNLMADRIAEGRGRMISVARTDGLTSLLNRDGFFEAAGPLLAAAAQHGDRYALFFIDVDQFKAVNDCFGHAAGDALLREIGRRLRKAVGAQGLIARQGGDEFLVLRRKADREDCGRIGARLLAALRRPVMIGERKLAVSASIGVSAFPRDALDIQALLLRADQAMYQAKSKGRNALRFFDAELQDRLDQDVTLVRELRAAVGEGAITAQFQPIVGARSGAVTGFEALARWESPSLGKIPPERFIAIAEQSGLIVELGRQMRVQACAFAAALRRTGVTIPVSVNVSQQELAEPDFSARLLHALETAGAPPEALALEITESVFQNHTQGELDALFALKAQGVAFALDDFGKGYSSHARLRTYPIDRLKIAVDFVGDVMKDQGARAVVRSLIDLGRRLRLKVTVEGVETAAQRDLVAALGADDIQGFWHHPALDAGDALALAARLQRISAALAG